MSNPVLIAHAEGEEVLAERLAEPIRAAGYEVAHRGTVMIGESVVAETSKILGMNGPVLLCGTVRAMGTGWARRVVNAVRQYPGVRVFIIQMEQDADVESVSFDEAVARYWENPVKAIESLLASLQKYYPIASTQKETGTVPPSDLRSLHQLPQPPADFTGREGLIAQLLADFEGGKGTTITGPIQGLTGMGGIGKTALGLVVAHQIKKDYPDAQIFLDLKGTTTPLSATDVMRHVILSFEPKADLSTLDQANVSAKYQSVLNGKRALLFLDNARSAEQIAPLRPPETCAVLATSRWSFGVPGLENRRVGVMSQESAEKFLLELCPRIGDQADELAKACAGLPLALRIAGSFLQVNNDYSVSAYVAELSDKKARLGTLDETRKEAELVTEPDLFVTFQHSYDQLAKEEGDANVQRYWRTLGVFPISFQPTALEAIWELEAKATQRLIRLYKRYSLIDFDETTTRYSLHDLLAAYALAQMKDGEEREARLKHAAYYRDVLKKANTWYLEGGEKILTGLRMFDLEWENIRTGQAQDSQSSVDKSWLELINEYPNAGFMILSLRLHPRDYIRWLEKGLEAARALGNKPYEGYHLDNLGFAYYSLGEARKAIELQEQALLIARETRDRRAEGQALGHLGLAYANLGDVRKAIQFYEEQLAIAQETGDRRGEGNALGNLGVVSTNLGDVRKAIQFYEQALVIDRETGDRQGQGQDFGNLGLAYADLGETPKAIQYYEQWLTITREIGDRRGEGQALGNLGNAYADLGEGRKAIELHQQSLFIARETGDRRREGSVLVNLGNAHYGLDEVRTAMEFHEQGLIIARQTGDRRGEGNASGNLGIAYAALGEVDKAIQFYEGQLAIARETEDRRGEGNASSNLGIAYAALGEVDKAIQFYEGQLAIAREIEDRRSEGNALFNMGKALHNLKEKDQAIDLVRSSLEIYKAIEAPNAKQAQNTLKEWGAL